MADSLLEVDSDLNDENSTNVPNDSTSGAQAIGSEVEVLGYVTRDATGRAGDLHLFNYVRVVYYEATLEAGQVISLVIADFGGSSAIDLDLYLFDTLGTLITSSNAFTSEIEQMTVLDDGEYFIVVDAFSGASNYALAVTSGAQTTPQNGGLVN
ncbi:MAG: pre-peptidase C-terminal domain-containing protein, partial [Parvularculaceae bacterium]|nr:pre-peptidase C-terminal domain-containing protein [Parvularculaceae bacterium]